MNGNFLTTTSNNSLIKINQSQYGKFYWWKKFLFPYYPLKFFKSIQLISFLSFLLGLHIILVYIGFNIPIINLQVGFDWIPTYLSGWFFGPIIGPIFGFIANNISWLQTGASFWYWMYAIQEPVVALFSSLISFYFYYTLTKKRLIYDVIIQQFALISFFIISVVLILLCYFKKIKFNNVYLNQNNSVFALMIASLVILSLFFLISEFYILYKIKKKTKLYNLKVYLSSIILISSMVFLFAIAVGPITNISFLYAFHFINNNIITGQIFLVNVISSILMQAIRLPFAILILYGILLVSIKPFNKIINSLQYRKIV